MSTLKTAKPRPSKGDEKSDGRHAEPCEKQGPSRLSWLHAGMNFVGGVGRLLDLANKFYVWCTDGS